MTDKAFSDLTSASALNDADIFAITQSGTSKKIASSVVKTYMQEGFTPTSTTTLNNKTVNLTNNTLTGTIAQFNSALSDADFCTIAGSETITNKTLTTPILSATVSGIISGRLGYLSGALSYGDGTNQQTVATLDRTQTFTAAQSFSGNVTLGDASGDTVTLNAGTVTLNNSTVISAASTKTLTLNGGAGSNGLVLDANNCVGVGISPASSAFKLDVGGINGTNLAIRSTGTSDAVIRGYVNGTESATMRFVSGGGLYWEIAGTRQLTLDSFGNLGLGVTPSANCGGRSLNVGNAGTGLFAAVSLGGAGGDYGGVGYNVGWQTTTGQYKYLQTDTASWIQFASGGFKFFSAPSGTAGNAITFNQAMTLDASGRLLVGTTSAPVAGALFRAYNAANADFSFGPNGSSSFIVYNSSSVGVYLSNGTQAWAGSSDERLKTDLITITNAVQKVATLRAVTGRFKTDAEGFSRAFLIAQDLQKVLPEAVDSEDPEKLGVRYTDTIPLLVAAIKELSAEIEILKQKVN